MNSITITELHRLQQAQNDAQMSLERAIFCISVFLAHEFVHCFTGFLTGSSQPGTPPGLNASPYSDAEHGEAGWYWTRHTFGGLGHVWFDKDGPAEPGHFGVPTLLEYNKRRDGSFFYQIDQAVIRRIIGADWAIANWAGMFTTAQFELGFQMLIFDTDPNWFLKLKDENTKTPFDHWNTLYEEVVARTTGEDVVLSEKFGNNILFELAGAVLSPVISSLSNLSLRNVLPLSSIMSRIRQPSTPLLPAANAISKAKRWGRGRIGSSLNKPE